MPVACQRDVIGAADLQLHLDAERPAVSGIAGCRTGTGTAKSETGSHESAMFSHHSPMLSR